MKLILLVILLLAITIQSKRKHHLRKRKSTVNSVQITLANAEDKNNLRLGSTNVFNLVGDKAIKFNAEKDSFRITGEAIIPQSAAALFNKSVNIFFFFKFFFKKN